MLIIYVWRSNFFLTLRGLPEHSSSFRWVGEVLLISSLNCVLHNFFSVLLAGHCIEKYYVKCVITIGIIYSRSQVGYSWRDLCFNESMTTIIKREWMKKKEKIAHVGQYKTPFIVELIYFQYYKIKCQIK